MSILSFLQSVILPPVKPPRPHTRMTEGEVLALANTAVTAAEVGVTLDKVSVHVVGGRLEWSATRMVLGHRPIVTTDDQTGGIGEVRWFGVR